MAITINKKILDALEMYSTKIKNVLISYNDVINNCASTSTIKPLSAAQGKNLQDQITAINNNKLITSNSGSTQTISSNANLNSYTTPGTYVISSDATAETISNMPRSASGKLIVVQKKNDTDYLMQFYIPTTDPAIIDMRSKSTSNWTDWTTINPAQLNARTTFQSNIDVTQLFSSSSYMTISSAKLYLVGQRLATVTVYGTTKTSLTSGTYYNILSMPNKLLPRAFTGFADDAYIGSLFEDSRIGIRPLIAYASGASIYLTFTYMLATEYT